MKNVLSVVQIVTTVYETEICLGVICGLSLLVVYSGQCIRHDDVAAHSLVLWEPQQDRASRGGQRSTFIDTLKRDTGLQSTSEIRTLMLDRSLWQATICGSRGDST